MYSFSKSWILALAFATAVLSLPNSFQKPQNTSFVRNHTEQAPSALPTITSISADGPIAANTSTCDRRGSIDFTECSCSARALAFSSSHATTTNIRSDCYSWPTTTSCDTWRYTVLGTDYSPPDECCYNCEVYVATVHIVYWPPNTMESKLNITAAPPVPYTLVSDGYTFTSPSVYVVYEGVSALRECFVYGDRIFPVGGTYSNITKAYDPTALSVAYQCYAPYSHFRPINYTELYYPPANSVIMTRSDCVIPDGAKRPPPADSGMAGYLQLSLPGDISSIDPQWVTCRPGSWGGLDPPHALLKVSGLGDNPQDPAGTPVATSEPDITSAQSPTSTAAATRGQAAAPTPSNTALDPGHASTAPSVAIIQPAQQDPAQTQPRPADPPANLPANPLATSLASPSANVPANTPTDHIADPLVNLPADSPNAGLGTGTNWPTATLHPQSVDTDKHHNLSSLGEAGINNAMSAAHTTTRNLLVQAAPNKDSSVDSSLSGSSIIPTPTLASQNIPAGFTGSAIVIGDPTQPSPLLTVGGQPIYSAPSGGIVFGTTRITAGGPPATISGTVISVMPSGNGILMDGSEVIQLQTPSAPAITAVELSAITHNGATLPIGGSAATLSGTLVPLGPSGLEIETTTTSLSTSVQRLGSLILFGLGASAPALTKSAAASTTSSSSISSSASLQLFSGDACRATMKPWEVLWVLAVYILAYHFMA